MNGYSCLEFREKDMDGRDITGKLYYLPNRPSEVGLVLGVGISGNRTGLDNAAGNLVDRLQTPAIVLNPPAHDTNTQEFSFGNFAYALKVASDYLRSEGVKKVIGGGHSAGPIAALFANLGYFHDIEERVIGIEGDEAKREKLYKARTENKVEQPPFDGLILASLPRNIREAIPKWMFNTFGIYFAHSLFLLRNRGNKTKYLRKDPKPPYQWQHMRIDDLEATKKYMSEVLNPHELIHLLDEKDENGNRDELISRVRRTPKLLIVPGIDIVSFGTRTIRKKKWIKEHRAKELENLREQFETLGIVDRDYHVFPNSAHWLNNVNSVEYGSLWGLKAPEVQELMAEFIQRFF